MFLFLFDPCRTVRTTRTAASVNCAPLVTMAMRQQVGAATHAHVLLLFPLTSKSIRFGFMIVHLLTTIIILHYRCNWQPCDYMYIHVKFYVISYEWDFLHELRTS